MSRFSIWDILSVLLILGVLCVGCGVIALIFSPGPLLAPAAAPTITSVVLPQDGAAGAATRSGPVRARPATWTPTPRSGEATAEAPEPGKPTTTLPPTNTPYVAPTPTPLPTFTPLPTATRANANCYVIAESPLDNAEFSANQEFTKSWTIKNNSGKTWPSNSADFRFVDGTAMQISGDIYDLPRDIAHTNTVDLQVRMRAPSGSGTYVGNWMLTADGQTLCRFFVKIVVK